MNDIKISIVVPVYNLEKYIENTVQSICNQTYRNLEIILVNDGSQDATPKLLDQLAMKDNRIKVLHKENGGVTKARLAGVEVASGEWIGFVDGDDYIEPDMYEKLLNNAVKYGADISHCGYQMVFPSRVDLYYGTGRLVEQDKKAGLKDLVEGLFVEPGLWNKIFYNTLLKEFLKENTMDTSIKINEDLLMNYYLFKKSKKSIYEDWCPYQYILRENSTATSKMNKHKLEDPLKVLKIIKEDTDDKEIENIIDSRIIMNLVNLATLSLNKDGEEALIKPYRFEARKELRNFLNTVNKDIISTKLFWKAKMAVMCPSGYSFLHNIYSIIKGTNKRYEVR